MSSKSNDKSEFAFGRFGKIVVKTTVVDDNQETPPEESLIARSGKGAVIGSVGIVGALYSDLVKAGATGVPY